MPAAVSAVVKEISSFFNRLVDLIPARYYRTNHDELDEGIDPRFMKKADKAARQQILKVKAKEGKIAKLSLGGGPAEGEEPEKPAGGAAGKKTPTPHQKGPAAGSTEGTGKKQLPPPALLSLPNAGASGGGQKLSRDELQERLQQRLEAFRHQRHQTDKQEVAKKAKDWKKKTLEQNAKRIQQKQPKKEGGGGQPQQQGNMKKGVKREQPEGGAPEQPPAKKTPKDAAAAAGGAGGGPEFTFPRVEGLDPVHLGRHGGGAGGKHGGKKPSKEQLLKAAEAKQKEKKEGGGGGAPADGAGKESWRAALLRASGQKVLDDPKLLRKSLKKEAKRKEKSSKGWQERVQAQEEKKAAKQNKRKDNIQHRIQGKVEKKKVQREKKLLRAGFEGRKAGFIGGGGAAGGKGKA